MPQIVIENGPDKGQTYPIKTSAECVAGRDSSVQIPIRDEMASRRHFQIEHSEGKFILKDLGSKNGVILNGQRVSKPTVLSANDRIAVGGVLLTFVGEKPHPLLGREVSGYRIEDRIGRGGMGTVYRALQLSLDRAVAMKILAPHLVENQSFINLFIREARAAGALSHPNIVQVYDVGVEEAIYFYSMEYIPHGSVEELLNKEDRLPLIRALEVVRDAALGLQYAELKGLVHRDIKPGNLMIGSEQIVKIGDLGIARFGEGESGVSQKDGVSGSPHYIAPEQARGKDIDHRADLYALGVSFYQMLCGRTPYRGSTPRDVILSHIRREPPPLAEQAPDVPPPVIELVEQMMARERNERIPSATAVLERLEPLLRRFANQGDITLTQRKKSRIPLKICGALLLLGALTGLITAWVIQHGRDAEARQQRLAEWTGKIELAERHQETSDVTQLTDALRELESLDLPTALMTRRSDLNTWLQGELQRQDAAARAASAARAFNETLEQVKSLSPSESIEAWKSFIENFSDSEEVEEAEDLVTALEKQIRDQATRERNAQLRIRPKLSTARTQLENGDFRRALETLNNAELKSAVAGTAADRDRESEISRIRELAQEEWDRLQELIKAEVESGEFVNAEIQLRRFRAPPFLDDEVVKLQQSIEEQRRSATQGDEEPASSTDPLGKAVAASWKQWAASDRSTLRAATDVFGIALRTKLSQSEKQFVDEMTRLMKGLSSALDRLGESLGQVELRVTLERADGEEQQVELRSLNASHLIVTIDRTNRPIDWKDLSPPGRIAVLEAALNAVQGLEQKDLTVLGLFALTNDGEALAEEIWEQVPAGEEPLISQLRSIATRARNHTSD